MITKINDYYIIACLKVIVNKLSIKIRPETASFKTKGLPDFNAISPLFDKKIGAQTGLYFYINKI